MTYFWRGHVQSGKWRTHALMWIWVLAGMPTLAQASPRFPVSSEQVLIAMRARAWEAEGVHVAIAAPITATVADPTLEIQTVTMLAAREARLRMVCRTRGACLPFFATVVWPESVGRMLLPPEMRGSVSGGNEPYRADKLPGYSRLIAADVLEGPAHTTLHVGTAATLVIDGARIHIRLQVICLESGALGDKVRVTTRDRKQAYVAEIVTPTMLKGNL